MAIASTERVLVILVLDPAPDGLDELEELLRLPLGLADDEHVRVDLVVALVQLEEEHVDSMRAVWSGGQYTTEPRRSPRIEEAMTEPADRRRPRRLGLPRPHRRRSARLAAGRRGDLRGADHGPARPADGGHHRRRRDRRTAVGAGPAARCRRGPPARGRSRRARSSTTARRPTGRRPDVAGARAAAARSPTFPDGWRERARLVARAGGRELGDAWASVVPDGAFTSLGWQGLLREQGPDQLTRRTPRPRDPRCSTPPIWSGSAATTCRPGRRWQRVTGLLRPGARLLVTDGTRRLADPNPARRADPDGQLVRGPTCAPSSTRPAPATCSSRRCSRRSCGPT